MSLYVYAYDVHAYDVHTYVRMQVYHVIYVMYVGIYENYDLKHT